MPSSGRRQSSRISRRRQNRGCRSRPHDYIPPLCKELLAGHQAKLAQQDLDDWDLRVHHPGSQVLALRTTKRCVCDLTLLECHTNPSAGRKETETFSHNTDSARGFKTRIKTWAASKFELQAHRVYRETEQGTHADGDRIRHACR